MERNNRDNAITVLEAKIMSGVPGDYKYERVLPDSVEKVFSKLSQKLKESGYVILSIVDVKETLKNSGLDPDFKPFYILDVCKPKAAQAMIGSNDEYGLLLPCRIMITKKGDKTLLGMLRVSEIASKYLKEEREKALQFERELIDSMNSI
ncbi:MAG: DUF302 domain-containing protein [Candidatus Thermoplasmatota archaeon]|jgi:uncharacterized protein (DUF302 family)|nr:DUF302 domain-containing protein [Candidatus Thermoplasmatota archaeon]